MDCIHCGRCTRRCAFLDKYQLDLEGFSRRPELAYHCFLCGECTACCPKGIDGREIALQLRRARVEAADGRFSRLPEAKPLRPLVWEKGHYWFGNYRHATPGSVLFPGCNFPSFFPATTKKLIALLGERAGMGVVMDCCGKPIYELGMGRESERIRSGLTQRLRRRGVTELVVLCPNCYYFLKDTLDLPVVSIYHKLRQLRLVQPLEAERFSLYLPCPDRSRREIWGDILPLLRGEIQEIQGVQCCGLGGCAAAREPDLARGFSRIWREKGLGRSYTYCASCVGALTRSGCGGVEHLLAALLGVEERPPLGAQSLLNRARFKLR